MAVRLPWERPEGKVQAWHRDRLAAVYVRQSTAAQVVDHQESTRLQYGLVDRAVALGWTAARVLVIDEDLGHSASGADARPGFQRLVSEVGLDHLGIVLGIEMSRLARSGREWHQLLELCALSGALLGDMDGVYDPAEHNDRMLLGLKGTISEAELHLIKQRMWSGRIGKARRGELAVPLPIGFVRRLSGEVVLDPDEQVRSVVRLVFDLFERLGTVNAVLCYLAVDPRRRQAGRPYTGRVRVEPGQWLVYLPGVLPSYIGVEQYERIMQRLEANRSRSQSQGVVRDGPALLAGLVVCGRCGAKMTVRYQRGRGGRLRPAYVCARGKSDYGDAQCQQLAGTCVDDYVTALLLKAVEPAALEVSLAAAGQVEEQRAQVDRIWRQRLERAEYAAERARRQYQLAEPENRLVVRQLEKDWEAALAERQRLSEDYDRFTATRPRVLTAAEREQIRLLAADIPAVWDAPTTTAADRKKLIRHLVEQVRIAVAGVSEKVDVDVAWAGGHRTQGQVVRPVATLAQLSYYPQLRERARELTGAGMTTAQIAGQLNAEGFRPPKRTEIFTPNAVSDLLRALGITRNRSPALRSRPPLAEHEWWLRDLAEHVGMPEITLDAWVRRGWATGYPHPQSGNRVVRAGPAEIERLRALHQVPRGQHNRRRWMKDQAAGINIESDTEEDDNERGPQE